MGIEKTWERKGGGLLRKLLLVTIALVLAEAVIISAASLVGLHSMSS